MKIAIMQPYFIPYAGYFRLFAAADLFVIYDDVQFIKGGWIHRNKICKEWVNIEIKRPHLGTIIEQMQWQQQRNMPPVEFIITLLWIFCVYLCIPFNAIRSSALSIPKELKGQDRVLFICELLGATEYINAAGGKHLYDETEFAKRGIKLKFLTPYENKNSILERIADEPADVIKRDIYDHICFS